MRKKNPAPAKARVSPVGAVRQVIRARRRARHEKELPACSSPLASPAMWEAAERARRDTLQESLPASTPPPAPTRETKDRRGRHRKEELRPCESALAWPAMWEAMERARRGGL